MPDQGEEAGADRVQCVSMRIGKKELGAILDFDLSVKEAKGIQLLTPAGRILLRLAYDGAMSVSSAQLVAGTSPSSYFSVLRRLKTAGLIAAKTDQEDGRVKILRIIRDK